VALQAAQAVARNHELLRPIFGIELHRLGCRAILLGMFAEQLEHGIAALRRDGIASDQEDQRPATHTLALDHRLMGGRTDVLHFELPLDIGNGMRKGEPQRDLIRVVAEIRIERDRR
jgi:hypothetical protein